MTGNPAPAPYGVHDPFRDVLLRHREADRRDAPGMYSVCSAHPLVLAAAVQQARDDGTALLVEATSNQVDQDGGYTGMRPADFRDLVHRVADEHGLDRARVVLGGDHLGPNVWRELGADEAMTRAETQVEAYVEAGFTKLHLDCSMACTGDEEPLTDEVVAARAARLASVAARTAGSAAGRLSYVIGTEVPVPGGSHHTIHELRPTAPGAARATIEAHRLAFSAHHLDSAWEQVAAVVVQPAVEFDHRDVVDFDPAAVSDLRLVVEQHPGLVFEAHSTDYQTPELLRALVENHWAVLKVGPGLTFALREALFALAAIEDELVDEDRRSGLVDVLERVMLDEPRWWSRYYDGDRREQRLARTYSYSDRVRYYWPHPDVAGAQQLLVDNLRRTGIPLPMLSARLPAQYLRVRRGEVEADPETLAVDRVRDVLRDYAAACRPSSDRSDRPQAQTSLAMR